MVKKKVSIRDKVAQIYQTLSDVEPDVKVNDTIVTYLDKIQQSLDKLVNTGSSSDNLMQFSTDVDTVTSGLTDSEKKVPSSALVKEIVDNIPQPDMSEYMRKEDIASSYSTTPGQTYDVAYVNDMFDAVLTRVRGL